MASGCGRNAKSEVQTWKTNACACEEQSCAREQRRAFWSLVQEFRDEAPSDTEALELARLVEEGQGCLATMSVDIYAAN